MWTWILKGMIIVGLFATLGYLAYWFLQSYKTYQLKKMFQSGNNPFVTIQKEEIQNHPSSSSELTCLD